MTIQNAITLAKPAVAKKMAKTGRGGSQIFQALCGGAFRSLANDEPFFIFCARWGCFSNLFEKDLKMIWNICRKIIEENGNIEID